MLRWITKTTTNKGRQNSIQSLTTSPTQSPLKPRVYLVHRKGFQLQIYNKSRITFIFLVPVCKMGLISRVYCIDVLLVIPHTSGVQFILLYSCRFLFEISCVNVNKVCPSSLYFSTMKTQEKFEDTKGVTSILKSKKDATTKYSKEKEQRDRQ